MVVGLSRHSWEVRSLEVAIIRKKSIERAKKKVSWALVLFLPFFYVLYTELEK